MLRRWRLQSIHARFLESCRNLRDGRDYWGRSGGALRGCLQVFLPIPLLGLHEGGATILDALRHLESSAASTTLREEVVRNYHRLLLGASDTTAGTYRKRPTAVVGSSLAGAPPEKIPAQMKQLDLKISAAQERFDAGPLDPVAILDCAVDLYQRLGLIHPFADGNGRVARLAMNHLLRRYGQPYVIFPPLGESPAVWEALQEAHKGRPAELVRLAREFMAAP